MEGGEIGFIVVGLLVIAILVGLGLYLYQKTRYNEYSEGNKLMKIKVTNETPFTHTITTKEGTYLVPPGATGDFQIDRFDDISAMSRRANGETVEFVHRLSNDLVNHLYISLDGFRTNLTSTTDAELVNASENEILFIQKSQKGNEKIAVQEVPPQSVVDNVYVPGGSLWMVAYASEPEISITEVKLGKQRISRLVFDGIHLRSY